MLEHVLVVPIGYKLIKNIVTHVVVAGQGTAEACDEAIRVAGLHENAMILCPAGLAGPKYYGMHMGAVMRRHIKSRLMTYEHIYASTAKTFNTAGEIIETARWLREWNENHPEEPITKVIFTVKDWHARRLRLIVNAVFKNLAAWEIVTHPLQKSFFMILREFIAYEKDKRNLANYAASP